MYSEEEYLSLSGIQHFEFCRRQWALIHIEQQWAENVRTVEGNHIHERAHNDGMKETRNDLIISRGMRVFSPVLGVTGVCDVVEFHRDEEGIHLFGREGKYKPIPVEYKRGKPKENDADALQLCAQAMCLEEMLICEIEQGYLFYNEVKRRTEIIFTKELRMKVSAMFEEMHQMFRQRYTPKSKMTKACNACSLKDICQPRLFKAPSVNDYITSRLKEDEE